MQAGKTAATRSTGTSMTADVMAPAAERYGERVRILG
jgi:hypothetical protein